MSRIPNKPSSYANYRNFAPNINEQVTTDPIAWSLYGNSLDAQFSIGSSGQNKYGLQGSTPQLYLAEKCAMNYDKVCEMVSRNTTILKSNVASIISPSFINRNQQTIGQALLDNAGQRRFGDLSNCNIRKELFNSLDPTSPYVSTISCPTEIICKPLLDPDHDILLNRILDEPEAHMNLLTNMYKNTRNEKDKYNNTRIGKLFEVFDNYLNN